MRRVLLAGKKQDKKFEQGLIFSLFMSGQYVRLWRYSLLACLALAAAIICHADWTGYEPHQGTTLAATAANAQGAVNAMGDVAYSYPMGAVKAAYSLRYGWVIGAGSIISRSTKWGVPRYSDADIFALDGQEIVCDVNGVYHTQNESYRKIQFLSRGTASSYWEVTDKSGTKSKYGITPDSRAQRTAGDIQPRLWAVSETRDRFNENITRYVYDTQSSGEYVYLTRIISGRTSAVATGYTATLIYYENKPVQRVSYLEGARAVDAKRVKLVVDVIGCNAQGDGGSAVRAFKINWTSSALTSISLVSAVIPYGSDVQWDRSTGNVISGQTMPATTFEYPSESEIPFGFESQAKTWPVEWPRWDAYTDSRPLNKSSTPVEMPRFWTHQVLADANGDGLPDVIHKSPYQSGVPTEWIQFNNKGTGICLQITTAHMPFSESVLSWGESVIDWREDFFGRYFDNGRLMTYSDLMDINGDGRPEHVYQKDGAMEIHPYQEANGEVSYMSRMDWSCGGPALLRKTRDCFYLGVPGVYFVDMLDVNGDGLSDKVYEEGGRIKVCYNTGVGFSGASDFGVSAGNNSTFPMSDIRNIYHGRWDNIDRQRVYLDILDINGDGLADKVYGEPWAIFVRFNTGYGWDPNLVSWSWGVAPSSPESSNPDYRYVRHSLSDSHDAPEAHATRTYCDFVDVNGDGLLDRVVWDPASQGLYAYLNNGTQHPGVRRFLGTTPNGIRYVWTDRENNGWRHSQTEDELIDINGDGLVDRVHILPAKFEVYLNRMGSTAEHLLKKINMPGGATVQYAYKRLNRADHPNYSVPGWVVDSVTMNNGVGQSETNRYQYYNGYYDMTTREDRGFGRVVAIDSAGNRTETCYLQDELFAGLVEKEIARDATGNIYSYVYNTYSNCAWHGSHYGYGVSQGRLVSGPLAYVKAPKLVQQDTYIVDGSTATDGGRAPAGGQWKRVKTTWLYDNPWKYDVAEYGDAYRIENFGEVAADGTDIGADRVKTEYDYICNTAYSWLVVPYYKSVQFTDGQSSSYSGTYQEQYLYDNGLNIGLYMSYGQATDGRLKAVVRSGGGISVTAPQYGYDTYGNTRIVRDANGKDTTTIYDDQYKAYPLSVVDAAGLTNGYEYDAWMRVTGTKDPNGVWTRSRYDVFGRVIKVIKPGDSDTYPTIESVYSDSTVPRRVLTKLREEAGTAGTLDTYTYRDGFGRTIQTKTEGLDSSGVAKWKTVDFWQYSQDGKQITESTTPYFTSSAAFSRSVAPAGELVRRSYWWPGIGKVEDALAPNDRGRTVYRRPLKTEYIDENLHGYAELLDGLARVIEVRTYSNPYPFSSLYRRDLAYYRSIDGAPTKRVQDADGAAVTWTAQYNGLGRMISETDRDKGTWSYGYDGNGNIISRTDARGQTVSCKYDAINRITNKTYSTGGQVSYGYDRYSSLNVTSNGRGRLTEVADPSGATEFAYDERGRVIWQVKSTYEGGQDWRFTYDSMDRVRTIEYPNVDVVTNEYGIDGNLKSCASRLYGTPSVTQLTYNAQGLPIRRDYGNGTRELFSYYGPENNYRLSTAGLYGPTGQVMTGNAYYYDPVGNITSLTATVNGYRQEYRYDHQNRLVAQTYAGFVGGLLNYSYDALDNILSKTTDGKPLNYKYNALRPHAVIETSDSYMYSYDANGNMISREKKITPPNPASSIPFTVQKTDAGAFDDGIRYSFDMATLDANGDGIIDVAVANNLQLRELFLGTGTGRLNKAEAGAFDDQANQSLNIVALDANGDGKTDLAVGNYTEMNMVFTNSGNGKFTKIEAGAFDDLGTHTTDLLAFDANGDGKMDLAEATYYYSYVYTNNGAGRFSLIDSGDFGKTNSWILSVEAFDADGDGDQDLVAGYEHKPPALFLNGGKGFFTQAEAGGLDDEAMKPEAFVALDIDGDGDKDLIIGNYGYPTWLFLNNGHGQFTKVDAGELDDRTHLTRDVVAFDMDRDGDMDLATANHGEACELYRNEGNGRYVKVSTSAFGANVQRAYCVRAVDVDRDGVQDLLYGNFEASNTLYMLKPSQPLPSLTNDTVVVRARGTSADGWPTMQLYAGSRLLTNWTVSQTSYLDYTYSALPQSLGLDSTSVYVRFNNDLFVSNHMHWGRWITQQGIATSRNVWVSGDFNGDGRCDVASPYYDGEFATIDLRISSGSSFALQRWGTKQGVFYVNGSWAAGDFSGDGKSDLVKVWCDAGFLCSLDVYRSSGSSFTTQRWCTKQGPWTNRHIWITGDFNGDGKTDVARIYSFYTAPSGGIPARYGRTDVYVSTGSGFVMQQWNTQGLYDDADRWVAGDFDNDGKCDLAVIYHVGAEANCRMESLRSTGTSFGGGGYSYSSFCPWRSSQKWQAGDVNGDRKADIICIYPEADNASIDAFYSLGVPPGGLMAFDGRRRLGTQQGGFWTSQSWLAGDYTGDQVADLANAFADGAKGSIDVHNTILDQDRNLYVDYVKVNNTTIQSEDRNTKYIVGNAQNSTDVRAGQETMFTNSWLKYPPLQDYTRSLSLAAYWRFDEGAGTTLRDSSDNGNHGTIFGGAAWVRGKQGYALRFDGTDDYVSALGMVGIPAGNEPYTIEAWIKPESMGARGIVGWGQYEVNSRVNALRLTGSGLVNYWWGNDLTVTTGSGVGAWHHVAATFDGTKRSIYVDGTLLGSDSPAAHNAVTQNLEIGRTYFAEYFHGAIDELAIWRRALTPNEIVQDFQKDTDLWIYSYDAENRLVKVMGTVSADYTYDYAGDRVKKVENGITSYSYGPFFDQDDGVFVFNYYLNGSLYAQRRDWPLTYIRQDHLGSVSRMTDEAGEEILRLEYLPYGSNIVSQGSGPQPRYKYTGQEQDLTGLYYYGARFYDLKLGRFLSIDPKGDNYCYALNNPIMFNDPSGEHPVLIAMGIGALVGYALGGTHGQLFSAKAWQQFDRGGAFVGATAGMMGAGVGTAFAVGLGMGGTGILGASLANDMLAGGVGGAIGNFAAYDVSTMLTGAPLDGQQALTSMAVGFGEGALLSGLFSGHLLPVFRGEESFLTGAMPSSSRYAPFNPNKLGLQQGVDPKSLTPGKDMRSLDPRRVANAWEHAGDRPIEVSREGEILDGHHRVSFAIKNKLPVDVYITGTRVTPSGNQVNYSIYIDRASMANPSTKAALEEFLRNIDKTK